MSDRQDSRLSAIDWRLSVPSILIFHPDLFEATQNYAPEKLFCLTLEDYVVTAKRRVAARRQNALMSQTGQK